MLNPIMMRHTQGAAAKGVVDRLSIRDERAGAARPPGLHGRGTQCGQHVAAQRIVHHVGFEMITQRAEFHLHVDDGSGLVRQSAISHQPDPKRGRDAERSASPQLVLDTQIHSIFHATTAWRVRFTADYHRLRSSRISDRGR
jgi:hypothetical protein